METCLGLKQCNEKFSVINNGVIAILDKQRAHFIISTEFSLYSPKRWNKVSKL